MGIPIYFHVITQSYPNTLRRSCPNNCKEYFLDYNGAIHQSVQKVLREEKSVEDELETTIMNSIWKYTEDCIKVVKPTGTVHICIDGVAPTAKMIQQRKRRYLSMFTRKLEEKVCVWDTNAISPGTPFMARLQAFLRARIRDDYNKTYNLSGSDDPGEGEHKIFSRIATLDHNDPIVIHGLDADLIMLSLMSHHPSIFLMREPSGPYKDQETENGFIFMDIDAFRAALLQELQQKYKWPITEAMLLDPYSGEAAKMIETYVCICFFLGNDFLPHPITLSLKKGGHERVLMAAKSCMEQDISFWDENNNPNTTFIANLLAILSSSEDEDLWKVNQDYLKKRPHTTLQDNVDSYPMQPQFKDPLARKIYEMKSSNKWRSLYYQHMFHAKLYDTSVIHNACTSFFQGIHWTYRYYKKLPKDPQWYYPYGYPPTLRDLQNFVASLSDEDTKRLLAGFTVSPSQGFVSADTQLLCIMPLASYDILPKKVKVVMTDPMKGCTHMYPHTYRIQTYLKTHLWECVPVLPWVDIKKIQTALDNV